MASRREVGFRAIPALVLSPLDGLTDDAWKRAPAGKWSALSIVEHLLLAIELTLAALTARAGAGPAARRRRRPRELLAFTLVHHVGWVPQGIEAPAVARPHGELAPAEARARLERAVAGFLELAARLGSEGGRCFARHPYLGDMNVEEWMGFHVWHCRHHARQILARARPGT